MYKNRISRPTPNQQPQFFIRRSEIEFDERARYVEFVSAVWNDGRFGPDLADPVILDWTDGPELDPASFLNLDDTGPNGLIGLIGPAPYDALTALGRTCYQAAEAACRRAKQMELLAGRPNALNSLTTLAPNQGRGSP